jgi:hypothetical protein
MTRNVSMFSAAAIVCFVVVGCAHYPESREQRPVYSYENVEMGSPGDAESRHEGTGDRDSDRRVR